MTANTTPRLGLMLPQGSDPFLPGDFQSTFTILDGKPGVTPIASYSALPTGLTTYHHGSKFLAMDSGAEWYWYKPSSSAGVWKRSNALGVLQVATTSSASSTTATGYDTGPTDLSFTVNAPGGRWLWAVATASELNNDSTSHAAYLAMLVNSSFAYGRRASAVGTSSTAGSSPTINWFISPPAAGTSYALQLTHYSQGTGGMATLQTGSTLALIEI